MTSIQPSTLQFPLKEIFPKEDFTKGKKPVALHFYIAHQNREATKTWSERMVKEYPQYLDSRDPSALLTPLAVSAMVGDLETAQFLVAKGANCKTKDAIGWTPLHYAYVRNDELMIAFLEQTSRTQKLGLEALKNREGLTPSQLIERMNIPLPEDSEEVFHYRNEEGEVVAGTAKKFRELTGAQFSHRILVNRKGMIKGWRQAIEVLLDDDATYTLQMARTKWFPRGFTESVESHLYLAKDPKAGKHVGFDVHAGERILAGQLITLYAGVEEDRDPISQDGNPYKIRLLNARDVRNMGGMINDSFPNSGFVRVPGKDGVSESVLIMAFEDIPKDSKVFVYYGTQHSVSWHHRELNLQGAIDYFTKHPTYTNPKELGTLEQCTLHARYSYLVGRPNLMYHLILTGVLNIKDLLRKKDMLAELASSELEKQNFLHNLASMSIFLGVYNTFKERDPSLAEQLLNVYIDATLNAPYISLNYITHYFHRVVQAHTMGNPQTPPIETVRKQVDSIIQSGTLAIQLRCSAGPNQNLLNEFLESLHSLPFKRVATFLFGIVKEFHIDRYKDMDPFYRDIKIIFH